MCRIAVMYGICSGYDGSRILQRVDKATNVRSVCNGNYLLNDKMINEIGLGGKIISESGGGC